MEDGCSGFYDFVKRQPQPPDSREQRLIVKVRAIHKANEQAYGSRRMSEALRAEGEDGGQYQAVTLMNNANIQVKRKKRFRVTTESKHSYPVAPNLLDRQFGVEALNTIWGWRHYLHMDG
jgi:putative transposase